MSLSACGDAETTLHCRDLLPPEQTHYTDLAAIFMQQGGAGCANCHNNAAPVYGYNFEGPGVTYDALTNKPEAIYGQLVTGEMPIGGVQWTDAEIKLFRSWYCHGGFYE